MENNVEQDATRLVGHVADRLKLSLAEKIARILGILIVVVLAGLTITLLTVFISLAAAAALTLVMPAWAAYLVITIVDILLLVLLITLRRPLIIYPLVAAMVGVLLERPIQYHEISAEKSRLEFETEKDRLRLSKSLESFLMIQIWNWIKRLIG